MGCDLLIDIITKMKRSKKKLQQNLDFAILGVTISCVKFVWGSPGERINAFQSLIIRPLNYIQLLQLHTANVLSSRRPMKRQIQDVQELK